MSRRDVSKVCSCKSHTLLHEAGPFSSLSPRLPVLQGPAPLRCPSMTSSQLRQQPLLDLHLHEPSRQSKQHLKHSITLHCPFIVQSLTRSIKLHSYHLACSRLHLHADADTPRLPTERCRHFTRRQSSPRRHSIRPRPPLRTLPSASNSLPQLPPSK